MYIFNSGLSKTDTDKIAGFGLFSPYIELMFITSRVGSFACKLQTLKIVKSEVLLLCEELKWTECFSASSPIAVFVSIVLVQLSH